MSEAAAYRDQFRTLVEMLDKQLAEVDDATLAKRPSPSLNPPGFIAWHLTRVWDMDINLLIGGRPPNEDAWHRGGFNDELGYEPLGNGPRGSGLGFGYSDTEVDALPHRAEVLRRYLAMVLEETEAYLAGVGDADLHAAIERPGTPFGSFTPAARLQHAIAHGWNHTGEFRMTKSMLGFDDPTGPRAPRS